MTITHKYAWITKSYKAYYQNHCNFGSNHYFVSNTIINFACIFCIPVNMQKSVNFSYGRKQLRIIIYYLIIDKFNPNCMEPELFVMAVSPLNSSAGGHIFLDLTPICPLYLWRPRSCKRTSFRNLLLFSTWRKLDFWPFFGLKR